MEIHVVEGLDIFYRPKVLLPLFGIESFLFGDVTSDLIFLFYIGIRFSGVTLALVSPVTPEKTYTSVRTMVYFGAGASDRVINLGPLVTFFVLTGSLGNLILPQIDATAFSFASFFLSLDYSDLLGSSSSSLAMFFLYF